jgi:dCMP deaminase
MACHSNCPEGCPGCDPYAIESYQKYAEKQQAFNFKGHPYWKAVEDRGREYPNIGTFVSVMKDWSPETADPIALPKETEVTGPREVPSRREYFIGMLPSVAARSKDPRNAVAAIIVGDGGEIRSTGYNGFPRDVKETPERWTRDAKGKYVCHAEINAIVNAARVGIPLEFTCMYVSFMPCVECAKAVINAGINSVIVDAVNHAKVTSPRWEIDRPIVEAMFDEAGIELIMFGEQK